MMISWIRKLFGNKSKKIEDSPITDDAPSPSVKEFQTPDIPAASRTERLNFKESCALIGQVNATLPDAMPSPEDDTAGVDFYKSDIEDMDYSYLTLTRSFISRSLISAVNFNYCDLRESFLCWNDFEDVSFSHSNLSGADLRASLFENVDFTGADLSGADLRGVDLSLTKLDDANLAGAKLSKDNAESASISDVQKAIINWHDEAGPEPLGG